jgi:MFS family permease
MTLPFETDLPARLDNLVFGRWHARVVLALGITWVLDGLEVTIVGALGSVLQEPDTLHMSATEVGVSGSSYIAGAIVGSLLFGHLADRLGRKRLFLWTLGLYVLATLATAASLGFASFSVCRFFTGMGIGGEYSAMNSAIDELIPARVRGFVDLGVNGSYWLGTALGAILSAVLLDPRVLGHAWGFRAAFGLGALLGIAILLVRRYLPESPRWLIVHGRHAEATAIVHDIEAASQPFDAGCTPRRLRIQIGESIGLRRVAHVIFTQYRKRAVLGLVLMSAQAFFYNAIFFTYALTLSEFYGVRSEHVGAYLLPFAIGNLLGPIVLGHAFDRVGRKPMIALTYALSGILLLGTGLAFQRGVLDATSHTLLWSVSFFFASAAASSAYLTVSELFPLELRALAIALFYAIGTGIGGLIAPALFGALIESHSRTELFQGYVFAAVLMIAAGAVAYRIGVAAEGRSLEEIAPPLSAAG